MGIESDQTERIASGSRWSACPSCAAAIGDSASDCLSCGVRLDGPTANELSGIERDIERLRSRHGEVLETLRAERDQQLVATRSASADEPTGADEPTEVDEKPSSSSTASASTAAATSTSTPTPSMAPEPSASASLPEPESPKQPEKPPRDLSRYAVRNALLLLGGLLLGIATVVFTIVSWGHLGIRAGILGVLTLCALGSPWLLVRRRLEATAETLAYLGLVMLPMSGLAIERALSGDEPDPIEQPDQQQPDAFGLPDAGVLWWAAAWSAVVAIGWAGYGRFAPLRLPSPTAVVFTQFPLLLAALALEAPPEGIALALIASALLALLIGRRTSARLVRGAAAVSGGLSGLAGIGLALFTAFLPLAPIEAFGVSGVLALGALLAAGCALSLPDDVTRWLTSTVTGIAGVVALATPLVAVLSARWETAGYAVAAAGSMGALTLRLPGGRVAPRRFRQGVAVAASGALTVCVVAVLPAVLLAATRPVWPNPFADPPTWTLPYAGPVVLGVVVLVAAGVARRRPAPLTIVHPRVLRARSRAAAVAAAGTGALAVPGMLELPPEQAMAVLVAVTAVLLAAASRARSVPVAPVALGLALYAGFAAAVPSLVSPTTAVLGSAALLVLLIASAALARTTLVQAATAAAGVYAGALLWLSGGDWIYRAIGSGSMLLSLTLPLLGLCLLVVALARVVPSGRARQARALDVSGRVLALLIVLAHLVQSAQFAGVPEGHTALVLAVAALPAAAMAWSAPRGWWRWTALGQAYLLAALAPVPIHESVLPALFGPYGWLSAAWTGAADTARAALGPDGTWQTQPLLVPVLLIAGAAAMLAAGAHRGRLAAAGVGRVALPVALAPIPLAANFPYVAALAFLVLLTVALAVAAVLSYSPAGGATLWLATLVAAWSLADQTATLAVLGVLAIAGVASAIGARNSPTASVASALSALTVGAEGAAFAFAGGMPAEYAAFVVLGVAVLTARTAVVLRDRAALAVGLELAAFALWCTAVWMSAGDVALLAMVLAVGGLSTVLAAARRRSPARTGLLVGAWGMLGLAGFLHTPALLAGYVFPYSGLTQAWSRPLGEMDRTADTLGAIYPGPSGISAAAVLAIVATAAVLTGRMLGGDRGGYRVATIAVPAALLPMLMTVDPPYVVGLGFVGLLVIVLAARTAVVRVPDAVAGGMALWLTSLLLSWSLYTVAGTLAALAGLVLTVAMVAIGARTERARGDAAMVCTLALGGLAIAGPVADGMVLQHAAFAVAGVGAVAAAMAALLVRTRRSTSERVELAGYGVGTVAVLLTPPHWSTTSLLLALTAVLLGAVSLRDDRRPARWAGLVLLQLAAWLQLGVLGVTSPEAYTVTITVAGLVAGWYARERHHALSSWLAYGPALALTMVPSLVVAWNDPGLVRPTLLAMGAFAVTLAGAWVRLQAPLLFGGAVLVANAAHELGPAVASLVGNSPRWLPIAVAGTLLLFAGATYEHRLRDLRRIRDSIVRMR